MTFTYMRFTVSNSCRANAVETCGGVTGGTACSATDPCPRESRYSSWVIAYLLKSKMSAASTGTCEPSPGATYQCSVSGDSCDAGNYYQCPCEHKPTYTVGSSKTNISAPPHSGCVHRRPMRQFDDISILRGLRYLRLQLMPCVVPVLK